MSDTDDARARNVRQRAYFIWQEEGCPDGRADDHWHRAWEMESEAALDEAVDESFPASDPPANTPIAHIGASENEGQASKEATPPVPSAPVPAKARRKAGRR
jgi:hypothetical protein